LVTKKRVTQKYYELRDDLVYKKLDKNSLLFYILEWIKNNVIRTCHDDLGHCGGRQNEDSWIILLILIKFC